MRKIIVSLLIVLPFVLLGAILMFIYNFNFYPGLGMTLWYFCGGLYIATAVGMTLFLFLSRKRMGSTYYIIPALTTLVLGMIFPAVATTRKFYINESHVWIKARTPAGYTGQGWGIVTINDNHSFHIAWHTKSFSGKHVGSYRMSHDTLYFTKDLNAITKDFMQSSAYVLDTANHYLKPVTPPSGSDRWLEITEASGFRK